MIYFKNKTDDVFAFETISEQEKFRPDLIKISKDEADTIREINLQKSLDNRSYQEKRLDEYPNIGDQLDALWKELSYRRLKGEDLTADADAMLGKILSVKKQYPKDNDK